MAKRTHSLSSSTEQIESEGMNGARAQMELFTFDVRDFAFKGLAVSFEHPIFSLTKEPDKRPRSYEIDAPEGMVRVEIVPSVMGLPTVYDQDILIYCASQLVASLDDGLRRDRVSPRVRFTGRALLTALGWRTNGQGYQRIKEALIRLKGAQIITNIPTGPNGEREEEAFSLIDGFLLKKSPDKNGNDRLEWVEVIISRWLYRAIANREVLTVHEGYLDLAPLEKRIYEIARKHCGPSRKSWSIMLSRLHLKSGSGGPEKKFNFRIRALAKANKLPGYNLVIDENGKLTVTHKPNAKVAKVVREVIGRRNIARESAKPQAALPLTTPHKPLPLSDDWTVQWEPSPRRLHATLASFMVDPAFDLRAELATYKAERVGTVQPVDPIKDFRAWLDARREAAILAERQRRTVC